jgi:hypothetical protein
LTQLPNNAAELMRWLVAAKRRIDDALANVRESVSETAEAERAVSHAWSVAYASTAGLKTVGEREAKAREATADLQYRYKLARGMERHAFKLLDSETQWLSALQSAAAAMRREAELARYESRETASP